MSEVLVENIVDTVFPSESSNEETGVCPFVRTSGAFDEGMASKLVQFIRDEKKKCQVSDAVLAESPESDLRVEKLASQTIEEIGSHFFLPHVDSEERQICGEEETIYKGHKQDIKPTCSEPHLAENIDVVLQPNVLKSITDYVKQSVYRSQLDLLCGLREADTFKKDTTRQELQDFFLEQVTKENIQKIVECKKHTLFIDKQQSEWIPLEEKKSEENVYTADDLDYDSVCPLTQKETVVSWIPTPPVCDEKYNESFVSVDELYKILCREGKEREKNLPQVTDSILQAPMIESTARTKSSQLNLLSDPIISNTFQELESSFKSPCVCPFKPMDTNIYKFPDEQRTSSEHSDKERICALSDFVTLPTEEIDTYASTCTWPLHFKDRKLSVSSASAGSSEAESLVQTALCNIWDAMPYEKELASESHKHDKPHSSESSIALDDLTEELLTDALISIFSSTTNSVLQESLDKSSLSSSQLNLFSENIVSDIMQGLKQSPESSVSSLCLPSSNESSGKDSSPRATLHKDNLRKPAPSKPQFSGNVSCCGKTAQKFTEEELASSSTSADSTVSRDADRLVETVLCNISRKDNEDLCSSELIQQEKAIQQKRATQLEVSSASSLSLNEFTGGFSKEDFAAIYSYVTDMLSSKSLTQPSLTGSQSQTSFLAENVVADIMQDLPEAPTSFPTRPSFDNASSRKLSMSIAAEQPSPTNESSILKITEGIQLSDSSSAEGTSQSTSTEAEDMVHIALNDLSITNLLEIEDAIPVRIVPRKGLTEFNVNPEIISEHLSVISIKTEPLEVLQQMTLLQTGQSLDEIRKASIDSMSQLTSPMSRRISFVKSGGSTRRGSLNEQGRLDVKRNEVIARNSFINLHNPDISKVELLKDVRTTRDLIIRLLAHGVEQDPDLDCENDTEEEIEIQSIDNFESVGMFAVDIEEKHSVSKADGIIKDEIPNLLLEGLGSIGDKTINDLSVEKLRYNIARSERRQSFEAFIELLRRTSEYEPGNELVSLQNWFTLHNIKEIGAISGARRGTSADGHIPHPPQERKPKAKDCSRTTAELKKRETKHQSKSSPK
ncbi:uncharacterized protein [Mobula birostris]|uniref:uncharacterized protein isoform X2 n=1 Tax=Mobula birostris TaxID=1983395 RepID=UPI003B28C033